MSVLLLMHLTHANSRLTEFITSSIVKLDSEDVQEPRSHKGPSSHVPVLLLGPDELLHVLVRLHLLHQGSGWEGT